MSVKLNESQIKYLGINKKNDLNYNLEINGTTHTNGRIYSDEWIQFNETAKGLYWPNGNNAHLYPNNVGSYGSLIVTGARGGYNGILLGDTQDYMVAMSSPEHQGLYNQANGQWIIYYNKANGRIGIGTSTLQGYNNTFHGSTYLNGITYINGATTVNNTLQINNATTLTQASSSTLGVDSSFKIGTAKKDLHINVNNGSGSGINDGYAGGITFGYSNNAVAGIYYQTSGAYGTRLIFGTTGLYADGTYARMIIQNNGYVGIGTLTPSYKLHVVGDIKANAFYSSSAFTLTAGKVAGFIAGQAGFYGNGIAISNPVTPNDMGWIRMIGTGESDSVLEIAVGDDGGGSGAESVVVRQYNTSNAIAKEVYLLNPSGDSSFPGIVVAPIFRGSLNGNADSATVARYLNSPDTRATAISPSSLNAATGVQFDFKESSITGLNSYAGVMSYRPYSSGNDWTGGPAHQLAFDSNGLHHRISSSSSIWGQWARILNSNNYNEYAPTKTGVGASGTWSISINGALQGTYAGSTVPLTDVGAGCLKYYYNVSGSLEGNMPNVNNANGIVYINTHSGEYGHQLGFSSNGNLYSRYKNGSTFTNSTAWRQIAFTSSNITGTAAAWTTARTLTLAGDLSGSVSIKGDTAMTLSAEVKDDSHNHIISNVDGLQTILNSQASGSNYIDVIVGGDANTYYPVILSNIASYYPLQLVNISRVYYETAPDSWYTATHRGGLTMTLLWNGSRYWDGNSSGGACYCVYKNETYSTMVGGLGNSTAGIVVWLRGGTAHYHIHSLNGKAMTATVYLSTYVDSANQSFAPKTTPTAVTVRWPGYATGADYASSAGSIAWDNITGKPSYLPLAGGTMSTSAAIKFPATAGSIAVSDPMSITYGRIAAYGTLCINANTDNSGTEYVILTAGKGHSSSTTDGLAVGTTTLTWQGATVLTSSNYSSYALPKSGGTASGTIITTHPTGGETSLRVTHGSSEYLYLWGNNSSGTRGLYDTTKGYVIQVTDTSATFIGSLSGNATSATKATQDANGYNISDTYEKRYQKIIDLTGSGYSTSKWYPVYTGIPTGGLRRVACVCQLNTGSVPSWSNHSAGFTRVLELLVTASGWGTTGAYSICLEDYTAFTSDYCPVGYQQFTNSSSACFFCRGGGKYIVETDWFTTWTIVTSSTTVSSQTIAPVTAYPGVNFTKSRIYANLTGDSIVGAVWNDYAEYRSQTEELKPGQVAYCGNDGKLKQTTERLQKFEGVVSDTFGFAIGETENCKTPLAVSGRVLVYTYEDRSTFNSGDCVCAAPNGQVSKMTREEIAYYPDRIVGVVSEIPDYEVWGTGNVNVDNRIWIKVK